MWLVALISLGVVLGRIQNDSRSRGLMDPISRTIQRIVSLGSSPVDSAFTHTSDFFGGILQSSRLTAENRRLRELAAASQFYVDREEAMASEIDSLRRLNKLPAYEGKTKIPALVTGYFPYESRMSLNVGVEKGLKPGMPVVVGTGLLGVISAVAQGSSQLNLLTSSQVKIGASVVKSGIEPQPGLLKGVGTDRMVFEYLETTDKIDSFDLVMTSGYSDRIPRGIPIGRVLEVQQEIDYGQKKVTVAPFAKIGLAREVVVLR